MECGIVENGDGAARKRIFIDLREDKEARGRVERKRLLALPDLRVGHSSG